jgi:hypothetical protein
MRPDWPSRLVGGVLVHRAITRVLTAATVVLVVLGANPGVAAAPSPDLAVFEWYKLSEVNARVSEPRLDSLRTDGFRTVYADVGEYLEVADQPASRKQRARLNQVERDLKRFVARASSLGFAVHAVGGGPDWTEETRRYLGPKLVQLVADYNEAAAANERLQGIQLDIEPYIDPSFFDDVEHSLQDYLRTLRRIVDTYGQVRTRPGNSGLRLGFAIPFWFDGVPEAPAVEFGPQHKKQPAAFHLIDMLRSLPDTYVLVMAYRNFTAGPDGSIEHVRREFDHASQAGAACGIMVGQEFGQVYPKKLSFWWAGRAAFRQAAQEMAAAYGQRPQFRGISVNDMNAYEAVGSRRAGSPGTLSRRHGLAVVSAVGARATYRSAAGPRTPARRRARSSAGRRHWPCAHPAR